MTNPFDPKSEDNSSNNGFGNGANNGAGNNGGLPRYETTNHPEDQAGFGQPGGYGANGGYGSNEGFGGNSQDAGQPGANAYGASQEYGGYGAYNTGQPGYAGANYGEDGSYAGPGPQAGPAYTGPVSAIEAIKWGFGAALKNPVLWILGAFVVGIVQVVPQISLSIVQQNGDSVETGLTVNFLSLLVSILALVISLIVYHLAYREIDTPKPTWGTLFQGIRWVQPLVVNLVLGVLAAVAMVIAIVAIFVLGFGGAAATGSGSIEQLEEGQVLALVGSVFGGLIVVALIALFIQPFFTLMPWLAADTSSIGEAFSQGLKLGKQNYSHILLLLVLSGLLAAASVITLGLALVVIGPALQLATAHLCRQCQGRYAPAA